MRRRYCQFGILLAVMIVAMGASGRIAESPYGAREGSVLAGSPLEPAPPLSQPQAVGRYVIDEDFADTATLPAAGWILVNNSAPVGTTGWFQGNPAVFTAHAGALNAYAAANFNNTAGGTGTISSWLVCPEIDLSTVGEFRVWTRSPVSSFPDRAEIRLCTAGSGNCDPTGLAAGDIGNFTTLLAQINPTLVQHGYPEVWTEYTFSAGLRQPATGRLAFRYYVTDGGPSGANSDYIGVDTWQVLAAPSVPAIAPLLLLNSD